MPDYWIQKTSTIFSQPDHGKDFKLKHFFVSIIFMMIIPKLVLLLLITHKIKINPEEMKVKHFCTIYLDIKYKNACKEMYQVCENIEI